jgi:hypothetical protein
MTDLPQDDDRDGPTGQQPTASSDPVPVPPPQPGAGSQYGHPGPSYDPRPNGPPPPGPPPGFAPPGFAPPGYAPPAPGRPGYGPQQYGPQQYGPQQYGPQQYGQPGYGQPGGVPGQPLHGQLPPYGQPPFGSPYGQPPPARKSRAGLIAALAGALVLLVAGGIVLAFALRSTVLDPRSVERDVAAQFEQREGVAVDLDCADDMSVEKGASYQCTGVTADEEAVTLQITVTDEVQAAYTWTEP